MIVRFLKAFRIFIKQDTFKLFNLLSLAISMSLFYTWCSIMLNEKFTVLSDGTLKINSNLNQIDVISSLASELNQYKTYSAINAIIIFWRILQFFSFSFNLSAFTEILSSSKDDIIFFLLMFLILMFGYVVMAYSQFGSNSSNYSDFISSIYYLFSMLNNVYDYDGLAQYNPKFNVFFFVSFMFLFNFIMKNMFIAIIVAHYEEFYQSAEIGSSADNSDSSAGKLAFQILKLTFVPQIKKNEKKERSKLMLRYIRWWQQLETKLFKKEEEDLEVKEEMKRLEAHLRNKYQIPHYNKKDLNQYLRPYILTEQDSQEKKVNESQKEGSMISSSLQRVGQEMLSFEHQNEGNESDREGEKIKGLVNDSKERDVLIQNYINVLPPDMENTPEHELTSQAVWLAALEKILYSQSQKDILFGDLLESEPFMSSMKFPIYSPGDFRPLVSEFMMKEFDDQIEAWISSPLPQKYEFWKVLDFEKMFDDQNRIREHNVERLETFFDLFNEEEQKEVPKPKKKKLDESEQIVNQYDIVRKVGKRVPVMSFKRIIRSPELQDQEFNRASQTQYILWTRHTSDEEKYELWFNTFNSYYRVKLWNKLCFSEDYLISVINTERFCRQDLILNITKTLWAVKKGVIDELEESIKEREETMNDNHLLYNKKKIQRMKALLERIKTGQIKLEDVAKKASSNVRNQYFTSTFFLECLNIIDSKHCKHYEIKNLDKIQKKKLLETYMLIHRKVEKLEKKKEVFIDDGRGPRLDSVKSENTEQHYSETNERKPVHQRGESSIPLVKQQDSAEISRSTTKHISFDSQFTGDFTMKKISQRQIVETKRFLARLLVRGIDQKKLANIETKFTPSGTNPIKNETKMKYFYLLSILDPLEERLPLWLALPHAEKLKLVMHQQIDKEAELMMLMLNEELESSPNSFHSQFQTDILLERALDNLVYKKYRRLTEWQALRQTQMQADLRLRHQEKEDVAIVELILYLQQKHRELDGKYLFFKKEAEKKDNYNQYFRDIVAKSVPQQHAFHTQKSNKKIKKD